MRFTKLDTAQIRYIFIWLQLGFSPSFLNKNRIWFGEKLNFILRNSEFHMVKYRISFREIPNFIRFFRKKDKSRKYCANYSTMEVKYSPHINQPHWCSGRVYAYYSKGPEFKSAWSHLTNFFNLYLIYQHWTKTEQSSVFVQSWGRNIPKCRLN